MPWRDRAVPGAAAKAEFLIERAGASVGVEYVKCSPTKTALPIKSAPLKPRNKKAGAAAAVQALAVDYLRGVSCGGTKEIGAHRAEAAREAGSRGCKHGNSLSGAVTASIFRLTEACGGDDGSTGATGLLAPSIDLLVSSLARSAGQHGAREQLRMKKDFLAGRGLSIYILPVFPPRVVAAFYMYHASRSHGSRVAMQETAPALTGGPGAKARQYGSAEHGFPPPFIAVLQQRERSRARGWQSPPLLFPSAQFVADTEPRAV
ncbi:hypothetical protein ON010_g13597 [Phytophthora cinnamomi]|nr:hypothetical protein ON010_g13597 [Phytophthora cinnamomi]